ncbi:MULTISPECIES: S8 family serine peptidase [unclassified Isoptericola]|uniref:S8 family serine peptidase n=1 Tax=unclassified Isoptericola TaxID=2623355 RepID=UPI00365FC9C9
MNRHARTRKGVTAVAALALLAGGATAAAADDAPPADTPPATPPEGAAAEPGTTARFTLVTGDVVTARIDPDGDVAEARIEGDEQVTTTYVDGDETYLVPPDAQPLVDAGVLDERFFDLALLWRDGYDDASRDTLPVIVERADGAAPRAAARGTTTTVELPAIDATALSIDKDRAAAAWAGLEPGSGARSASGVERLWLDAKVHGTAVTDLPPTVPLTGADAAHDLGLDGSGVRVAVLDTGYDQQHPDLAGQVVESRSFVPASAGTIQDGSGHGTHTASTVAGTGAASDGRYAGMAPGADLLVGKVLGDDGSGLTSGILAGMQWAVDEGADVVSMSLGDSSATACVGPDVDLVEELSDEALFVIAAGNEGLRGQVSTPGCAPSALTVGAVDRDDATAYFSSRGPSVGGAAAKPDIASQGVEVVAARTGGGSDLPYVAMSGTSMATPHVAGGAALVQQAHPDWTPVQVKDALTSSAAATDAPVLEQGAGPMDAGRAVGQPVTAPAGVDLGTYASPQAGLDPVRRTVTLTNTSDADVALRLSLRTFGDDGTVVPTPVLALDRGPRQVVVPAHGTADVPVVVDPAQHVKDGAYGTVTGRLVGVGADGVRVTVPVWAELTPPMATVTVETIDRRGEPADSFSSFQVIDAQRGRSPRYGVGDGSVQLSLPYGTYDFSGVILTRDAAGHHGQVDSVTQVVDDGVRIDGDTTVRLDARDATELTWRTDRPSEPQGFSIGFTYGLAENGAMRTGTLTTVPSYVNHLFTTRTRVDDRFTFEATARLVAPRLTMTSSGGRTVDDLPVALAPEFDGEVSAPLVSVGPGTTANLEAADVEGKVVLLDAASAVQGGNTLMWDRALKGRGALGVLAYSSSAQGRITTSGAGVSLPMVTITREDGEALLAEAEAGPVTMTWSGQPVATSPYLYNVATVVDGSVPSGPQRVRDVDLATVPTQYSSQGLDSRPLYLDLALELPGASGVYAGGSMLPAAAPLERTEYYTASEDVRWTTITRLTTNLSSAASYEGPRTYQPGVVEPTSWLRAPLGAVSNTNGVPLVERSLDGLAVSLGVWGDAAGHDSTGLFMADSWARTLWVDGTRVVPAAGTYAVPSGRSEVHLQQTFTRRPAPGSVLGLGFTTDWTFPTERTAQGTQPLLVPHVDVATDPTGRVPAGQPVRVTLGATSDATRRPVDLATATLQYATGAQTALAQVTDWRDVPVTRGADGTWTAEVPNDQAAGGFVHLRTVLTGADGGRVEQSMLRVLSVAG